MEDRNYIKKHIVLTLAIALLALPACAREVVVTDGDTLKVHGTTWRLWGIDAPEGRQTCQLGDQVYDCGDQATQALVEIIGTTVPLCRLKDTDRYGRSVGQCYVDGQDIGAQLVRQGWALDFKRYSNGHYAREEDQAKTAKRGMWAGAFKAPWDWRKAHR